MKTLAQYPLTILNIDGEDLDVAYCPDPSFPQAIAAKIILRPELLEELVQLKEWMGNHESVLNLHLHGGPDYLACELTGTQAMQSQIRLSNGGSLAVVITDTNYLVYEASLPKLDQLIQPAQQEPVYHVLFSKKHRGFYTGVSNASDWKDNPLEIKYLTETQYISLWTLPEDEVFIPISQFKGTATVSTPYGTFKFCKATGKVTETNLRDYTGPVPVIVNVHELLCTYGCMNDRYDISDVGVTDSEGAYTEPDMDWRNNTTQDLIWGS